MKKLLLLIPVFPLMCFLNGAAFAQTTVSLTEEDPQGFFWDAGNSQWGGNILQIYQAFVPNEPSQSFTWTQVSGGWKVCSLHICLSDNGRQVVMGAQADVWNITSQHAVQNARTGNYIQQASNPGNGAYLATGTTPFVWTFALAGASSGGGTSSSGPINIMPLGDSITEGWATSATFAQGGYRCPLYSLLTKAKTQFTFVGDSASLETGVVTACPDVNWEGHGGYDIASIQNFESSDGSIQNTKPSIILLLVGTNDVAQNEVSSVSSQLTALLNGLFAQDPNTFVIISTIPPMNPSAPQAPSQEAGWAPQVPSANAQIKATAAKYAHTSVIDFYSAVVGNVNANIGSDGVHPSVTGYGILANLWSNAIAAHLAGK